MYGMKSSGSSDFESSPCHQFPKPKHLKILASNVKFPNGNKLLHQFVLENSEDNTSNRVKYIDVVLRLMSGTLVNVNELNDEGYSALHLAALKNSDFMVRKLLTCFGNIDIGVRDKCDRTPLMLAAHIGHVNVVRALLEGGDINIWDWKALCAAAESGHVEVVRALVDAGGSVNTGGTEPLCLAAMNGHAEVVRVLLEAGWNVDEGGYFLISAARNGHVEVVRVLLEAGVDANEGDSQALISAAEKGHVEVVRALLEAGGEVNASGCLDLWFSKTKGATDIFEALADGDDDSTEGSVALHLASLNGHAEVVKALLEAGGEPLSLRKC